MDRTLLPSLGIVAGIMTLAYYVGGSKEVRWADSTEGLFCPSCKDNTRMDEDEEWCHLCEASYEAESFSAEDNSYCANCLRTYPYEEEDDAYIFCQEGDEFWTVENYGVLCRECHPDFQHQDSFGNWTRKPHLAVRPYEHEKKAESFGGEGDIVYSVHLETLDGDTVWGGEYYLQDFQTEKGLLDEAEFDLNYAEPAWRKAIITKSQVGSGKWSDVKTILFESESFSADQFPSMHYGDHDSDAQEKYQEFLDEWDLDNDPPSFEVWYWDDEYHDNQ